MDEGMTHPTVPQGEEEAGTCNNDAHLIPAHRERPTCIGWQPLPPTPPVEGEAEESPTRCASVLAGAICPDDLCRNASEKTLCGAYVDDMRGESEWDTPEEDETWDYES